MTGPAVMALAVKLTQQDLGMATGIYRDAGRMLLEAIHKDSEDPDLGEWIEWEAPEGVHPIPENWAEVRCGDGYVFEVKTGTKWSAGTRTDDYELIPECRVVAYRVKRDES